MRQLILFRHAKSSWADPELEDHDRPLNQRGRLAATLMGAWLAEKALRPDAVLVSSSARTQETWRLARGVFDDPPAHETHEALYHADPATMLEHLHARPASETCVALIGHQPGIGALCRKLTGPKPNASCARAFEKFPTAAVALLEFDGDAWPEIGFGLGRFDLFVTPRDLV
jgi:phosphohistidine phosphatase